MQKDFENLNLFPYASITFIRDYKNFISTSWSAGVFGSKDLFWQNDHVT